MKVIRERRGGPRRETTSAVLLGTVAGVLIAALLVILDHLGGNTHMPRAPQVGYDILAGVITGLLFCVYVRR